MHMTMNAIMKSTLYEFLRLAGIYSFARQKRKHEALILTYHGVLSNGQDTYVNRNCVSARMFENQLRWLKQNYQILPLSDIVESLEKKRKLPPFTAAITFDDGFRNNYTVAFPILVRYNVTATVFLTTDFIGKKNARLWTEHVDALIFSATVRRIQVQMNGSYMEFDISTPEGKIRASDRIRGFLKALNPAERQRRILALERQIDRKIEYMDDDEERERYEFLTWDDIRTMAQYGIEFGSHTRTHQIVAHLSPAELEDELINSRQKIETELGRPCTLFSYPNGTQKDFTKRDQNFLKESGYRAAFSQIYGFNAPGVVDLFALRRINIVRSEHFSFFLAKISGIWGEMRKKIKMD